MSDIRPTYEPVDPDGGFEESTDQRRTERTRNVAGILGLIVLVLLFVALFVGRVPSTLGTSRKSAVKTVAQAGFRSEVTTVAPGDRPGGIVVDQRPNTTLFLKFWPVKLYVTGGGGAGMHGATAHTVDLATGLDYGSEEYVPTMPDDAEEVDPLYEPLIGMNPVMPNVQNMSEKSAIAKIRAVGLPVDISRGPSTVEVARGRVYYQSPTPGSLIESGERARIWVSDGPLGDTGVWGGGDYPRP